MTGATQEQCEALEAEIENPTYLALNADHSLLAAVSKEETGGITVFNTTQAETLTKVSSLLTEKSWFLDMFAKNFIGSFDTTKYGSIPMIYVETKSGLPTPEFCDSLTKFIALVEEAYKQKPLNSN